MSSGQNYYSDYGSGSGSSTNSSSSWVHQDTWSSLQTPRSLDRPVDKKSSSYQDLVTGKCTLEDIMKEFQMNGMDSPYTPVEDRIWSKKAEPLSGMGPAGAYVRQRSWPAPERSPAPRLARPRSAWLAEPAAHDFNPQEFTTSTPVEELCAVSEPSEPGVLCGQEPACVCEQQGGGVCGQQAGGVCSQQARVLRSLPDAVLTSLLHELEARQDLQKRSRRISSECRFCKNNGERESYYRSHALKDGAGRVTCPVLRAFVCKRCGARGDSAHTSKYCPLSTADERMKSTAMMRSVRMASGRRRPLAPSVSADEQYVVFGQTTPSIVADNNAYNSYALTSPLDPLWAALEQKLML